MYTPGDQKETFKFVVSFHHVEPGVQAPIVWQLEPWSTSSAPLVGLLGLPKAKVLILRLATALVWGHTKDSTVLPVGCSHQLELALQLQILFVPCSACTQRLSPVRYLYGMGDCCLLIDIKIPQGWGSGSSAEARSTLPEDHGSIPGTHRVTSEAQGSFCPLLASTGDKHT